MVNRKIPAVTLHNAVKMPQLGFGVYKVEKGPETVETVKKALEAGYRSIDTAALYNNEEGVGQAIRESGISREEIFITTKVWNSDQGYESTLEAFETSISKLGLHYIDLYLVHWPVKGKYVETWRALEKLYKDGRVRAIGVSNFQIHHLEDLFANSTEKPVINQVELHPRFSQTELRKFCSEHNIAVEAWSPLGRGQILDEPTISYIAEKHGKTPAQVLLRWHLQNGIVVIPKSVTPSRIEENINLFDFELSLDEMQQIDALNMNERFFADPDNFDF
ncbi:aldo/keto reductase [Peribacillus saganii]|uniref:Aldo/keto reductase n=1 Tax=Peribacillus saganii TaxID=2303992 RepID=A0A372LUE6_9BACI|nr:aldo/keto reductase [Peribacillus saganii]RFU71432.1 aldo/keto reductase [Peribacillus saganii]